MALGVALAGYAVGSIQATRLVHRAISDEPMPKRKPFEWGDGNSIQFRNLSATTLEAKNGPAVGMTTAVLDMSKAVVPAIVLRRVAPGTHLDVLWAGASFVGHVMPPQHGFNGGRGTAILLGTCLLFDPLSVPVSMVVGQYVGLYVLRNALIAHHMGWIVTLPVYFAVRRKPELFAFALAANVARWAVSVPELRQIWHYHRRGEMRTREFHEMLERSHHGKVHQWLRERGLIHYEYMQQGETQT